MRVLRRFGIGAGIASLMLATTMLSPAPAAEAIPGQWQSKSQMVFDADAQKLVRRTVRVWNPQPELDLEFTWVQQSGAQQTGTPDDADGTVAGTGVLTWRVRGSAPYDRRSVYSEYRGEMHNGRPHGNGTLTVQTGLSYEGEWHDGVMQGHGAIKYPNGDEYRGELVAGLPHGHGRYASADGSIVEGTFRNGARPGGDGSRVQMAQQAAPRVTLKAYTDRQSNQKFVKEDDSFKSFVYDQETTPDGIRIRLASKEIMDVWKGNAVLPEQFKFFEDAVQFAPALLVVEVVNEAAQAIQFVGGYVDVTESYTDRQPFLEYVPPVGECAGDKLGFEATFTVNNLGWGEAKNTKATYGFGRTAATDYTNEVGTIDRKASVSALDGLRRAGVDVAKLQAGGFKCPSKAQVPACLTRLSNTGVFGRLAGSVTRKEATVLIRTAGRLNYDWVDAYGATKQRQSPFAADLPLLTFDTGSSAECGAPAPVERDIKPVKFTLDKKNYRIPLGYRGSLAPRQNRRFALALSAEKSSQHYFKIVLELADGRTITTPRYDFLYFLPNLPPPDAGDPDPTEQPGKN